MANAVLVAYFQTQLSFLGELCTYLECLTMNILTFPTVPRFWCGWKHLKEISFDVDGTVDLNYIYCGIHSEEAAELRRKGVQVLKSVHSVPIRQPLAYFSSKLRTVYDKSIHTLVASQTCCPVSLEPDGIRINF